LDYIGKKLHFIGIGGIGMSALAHILLGMGVKVSGSDAYMSEIVADLKDRGAQIFIGHAANQVPADADFVVYSSAIRPQNPEILVAKEKKIKIISRAELLAKLMQLKQSIAVAGAHGKTTTTGMISTVLLANQKDPSIVIGGILHNIGSNARLGHGDFLVAEADESDGSFLLLKPRIAVVTNISNDHLDHYGSMENLVAAFSQFVAGIPVDSFSVLGIDSEPVAQLAVTNEGRYVTFGLVNPSADYTAKDITFKGCSSLSSIYYHEQKLGELVLRIPGLYNISNALAAIAVSREMGLSFEEIAQALAQYAGTGRRFEILWNADDIMVVHDYAHHPTEIKAVLSAAKNINKNRVLVVFQPHRYSRTQQLLTDFAETLMIADKIIINEIYSAFEDAIPGLSGQTLVDAIKNSGHKNVEFAPKEADVLDCLNRTVQKGDIVMVVGAGPIYHTGQVYAEMLKRKGGSKV